MSTIAFTQIDTNTQTNLNDGNITAIRVNGVESTPTNIIDALELTRRDGKKKIGSQYDDRKVTIEGEIYGSDAADLRARLLAFKRDVAGDGMLDVQLEGEASVIRFNVTVVNIAVPSENYHISFVPYSMQLTAMDPPFGEDVGYTDLFEVLGTSNDVDQTSTLGGSAEPSVNLKVTVPTVGNLAGLEFRNNQTNTGLLLQPTFAANDTIVIDTGRSTCKLNGSPADFNGQVPEFIAGSNNWRLNFLTDGVTIEVQQQTYTTEKFIYNTTILAQSFQPTTDISTQRIDVMLARLGNPTSVKLSLYTNSSSAPGTAITGATATISGSTIPITPAYISFNLQNVAILSASTTYWIVVEITGAINDVENGAYWKASGLNPYANGNSSRSANSGSTWTADTNTDMVFRVWKAGVLASNIDTSQETYTEDFTTSTNKDASATTASWDTAASKVILGT